jgi:hypothetical protein
MNLCSSFNEKIIRVSDLTGISVEILKDRAIRSFIEEYVSEYLIPELCLGNSITLKEALLQIEKQLGWSYNKFSRKMYKWWLNSYRYFNRDVVKGLSWDFLGFKNLEVFNGVVIWFDLASSNRGVLPDKFQIVPVNGNLCRVGVSSLCGIAEIKKDL